MRGNEAICAIAAARMAALTGELPDRVFVVDAVDVDGHEQAHVQVTRNGEYKILVEVGIDRLVEVDA